MGCWSLSNSFDDELHSLKLSEDGSYTAFSKEYDEHYHSTKDGALKESLVKHIIPAFSVVDKDEINILDICYGLGFNTLATILYVKEHFPKKKVNIYSPELDATLVRSLVNFTYPDEFKSIKNIILALSREGNYNDYQFSIELFLGDAREYIKRFENKFDIVYQDAFSPSVNPVLWTKEYFRDIRSSMKEEGVLTSYSIAFKTRLAMYENGLNLYTNSGIDFRTSTVASIRLLEKFVLVDMLHKISCNKDIMSLKDDEI